MMEILEALKSNPYLTEEVKKDMENNLRKLFSVFPNIDINYVIDKLGKLQIKSLPRLGEYEDVKCITGDLVCVSKDSLEAKDGNNISMQILLKGLFPNVNPKLEAIYNGMTEMIANTLVGGSSESDEYFICELLEEIINLDGDEFDTLETAYLSGNISLIVPFIEEKMGTNLLNQLLDMCNQNYMRRKTDGQSLFPEIEKNLITTFYKQNPNKEAVEHFDSKLILDPRFFEERANQYVGLYEVADTYDNIRNDYFLSDLDRSKAM